MPDEKWKALIEMMDTYLKVVGTLTSAQVGNKKIYVTDTEKGHIHFRANDFRKALQENLPPGWKVDSILKDFRTLQLILCESDRFTNIRWINEKSIRVITVDMNKYLRLRG